MELLTALLRMMGITDERQRHAPGARSQRRGLSVDHWAEQVAFCKGVTRVCPRRVESASSPNCCSRPGAVGGETG